MSLDTLDEFFRRCRDVASNDDQKTIGWESTFIIVAYRYQKTNWHSGTKTKLLVSSIC